MKATTYLAMDAEMSEDGAYRYWLSRRLSMGERAVLFVGLNPSTADATVDDPTIRRCAGFARLWGFDWLFMGNVHAYRSTDPRGLALIDDPVGPGNADALTWLTRRAEVVVAAWGNNRLHAWAQPLAARIAALPHTRCLGVNANGTPKHPLYLRSDAPLVAIKNGQPDTLSSDYESKGWHL